MVILTAVCAVSHAQDLKTFKLPNGMSVYIWEDHSKPNVYGEVVVKTGSVNDPPQYTGLAHYLEHVMFKGTQKIGALDWQKEKPLYESIINAYDQMAETTDPATRANLSKQINELTVEAGKYSVSNEFSNLIEGIAGTGLNAGTSYDMTFFHNSFPSNQLAKWLLISSERFINPVFRTFQAELETVYEEYNMYGDNANSVLSEKMFATAFPGSPYGRPVIGYGDHLKNPRLSQLIKFYQDWYVPSNMALILVGDVDAKVAQRIIMGTFGRLQPKQTPERTSLKGAEIQGRVQISTKISQRPSVMLIFNGVKSGSSDEIPIQLCAQILGNSASTGILDELSLDGKLMWAGGSDISFVEDGRIILQGVPVYSNETRGYDTNKNVEKLLLEAVEKLKKGEYKPELLASVKTTMLRDFDLMMEGNQNKASLIREAFVSDGDLARALAYREKVEAVTAEDIHRVANEYFNQNFIVMYNEVGKLVSKEKIKKPEYKIVESPEGQSSAFAQWFRNMPAPVIAENYLDWSKVKEKQINSYSRLYYVKNEVNDVFTLTLKYGASAETFPRLQYAAGLIETAGIMAQFKSQELKSEFGRLGITVDVHTDRDYLYFTMRGYEANLEDACKLLTKLVLMPAVDEDQMKNIIGMAATTRIVRKKDLDSKSEALIEYIIHGENSKYKKEITDQQLVYMNMDALAGDISRATHYAAEIHYSGLREFDDVASVLSKNLPLVEGELPSESPKVRPTAQYDKDQVIFIADNDAKQAQIYFYVPVGKYDKSQSVVIDAYNRYMGSGLDGVIMGEIREKNSMAYTAYGVLQSQRLPGSDVFFLGYIGTQSDKAIDAISLMTKMIRKMPEKPEAIEKLRNYLYQTEFTGHPSTRELSYTIAKDRQMGYTDDPSKERVPMIQALTFDDIVKYAETNIQDKPIVIGIVGNPKNIPSNLLEQFGTVSKIKVEHLFNEEDVLF